jgi:hypothetical protein
MAAQASTEQQQRLRAAALAAASLVSQPLHPGAALLSSAPPPSRAVRVAAALRAGDASRFAAPPPAPPAGGAGRRRARAASQGPAPAGHPAPRLPAGCRVGRTLGALGAPAAAPSLLARAFCGGVGSAAPPPAPLASGATAPLLRGAPRAAPPARGWFDLPTPVLTDDLKRELAVLRNRAFLDPKRHYKTAREDRERALTAFSVGTVVEAPAEKRARLSARERKPTMVDALLADGVFGAYAERTMAQVHARGRGASAAAYKAKKIAAGADWKKRRSEFKAQHKGGGRARPRY